jgi:MFS superfamily sulfate permease-like transporter
MLTRKRAYRLSITAITFLLGAAFQFLLAQWLPSRDVIPLSLIVIVVGLVLILTISSDSLSAMESVIDLAGRSGIRAEYIEDDRSGRSYRRSSELIKMWLGTI